MPAIRRAAAIWHSLDNLRASIPPIVEQYLRVVGVPGLFRFVPESSDADDGWTTLAPNGNGRYKRIALPDKGANLAGTSQTIYVTGGPWRVLPASSLTTNITITLGTTGAQEGDTLELTRLDVGAYTAAIANGGNSGGTLCTMPVSARAWGLFYFDGTDWLHRRSGLML